MLKKEEEGKNRERNALLLASQLTEYLKRLEDNNSVIEVVFR